MKRVLLAVTLAGVLSGTALAGDMPGVGKSTTKAVSTVESPVPEEMPSVGSATSEETESSLITTVLLTIITFFGR